MAGLMDLLAGAARGYSSRQWYDVEEEKRQEQLRRAAEEQQYGRQTDLVKMGAGADMIQNPVLARLAQALAQQRAAATERADVQGFQNRQTKLAGAFAGSSPAAAAFIAAPVQPGTAAARESAFAARMQGVPGYIESQEAARRTSALDVAKARGGNRGRPRDYALEQRVEAALSAAKQESDLQLLPWKQQAAGQIAAALKTQGGSLDPQFMLMSPDAVVAYAQNVGAAIPPPPPVNVEGTRQKHAKLAGADVLDFLYPGFRKGAREVTGPGGWPPKPPAAAPAPQGGTTMRPSEVEKGARYLKGLPDDETEAAARAYLAKYLNPAEVEEAFRLALGR